MAQWVLSLTRRQLVSPTKSTVSKKKVSTTSITSNESRASRQSSISSSTSELTCPPPPPLSLSLSLSLSLKPEHQHTSFPSGSTASNKLDNYLSFHESLLGFYETFVMVYRVPVFSLLWPLLRQLEPQVSQESTNFAPLDITHVCASVVSAAGVHPPESQV